MALNIDIEKKDPQGLERMTADEKPFSKKNYYMMGGCLALDSARLHPHERGR